MPGTQVPLSELEEGDTFRANVRWFDERDTDVFEVTEASRGDDGEVVADGDDGHTYRFHCWDHKVRCNTDDKAGSHRGNHNASVDCPDCTEDVTLE